MWVYKIFKASGPKLKVHQNHLGEVCMPNLQAGMHGPTLNPVPPRGKGCMPNPHVRMHGLTPWAAWLTRGQGACLASKLGCTAQRYRIRAGGPIPTRNNEDENVMCFAGLSVYDAKLWLLAWWMVRWIPVCDVKLWLLVWVNGQLGTCTSVWSLMCKAVTTNWQGG